MYGQLRASTVQIKLQKVKAMENLKDLFEDTLQDMYWAEKAIVKAIPKMAAKATAPDLKAAFQSHLKETEGQIKRLEQVFELMGEKPKAKKCDATEGLVKEADDLIGEAKTDEVMDAGLISSAQAVEHYEIARYGTLRTWAEELDMPEAAALLQETLDQEHACNDTLTGIATGEVNIDAEDAHGKAGKARTKGLQKSSPRVASASPVRSPAK